MSTTDSGAVTAARLRVALDLYEAGEEMMRATLHRRHPEASPAEIEAMLREWLAHRPGAAHGDAAGSPVRRTMA